MEGRRNFLSPGRQMAEGMENGKTLEDYIEEYGGM